MSGVFLLNPDRYMTPEFCALTGVQFAWTREYLALGHLDVDDWKGSMQARSVRHIELNIREANKMVNPELADSIWEDKYAVHLFDPVTLSPYAKLMAPSGVLFKHDLTMSRHWLQRFPARLMYSGSDMFRYQFNALSVLFGATNFDLDVDPRGKALPGDRITTSQIGFDFKGDRKDYKIICDTCVVRHKCDYARKGSVCVLPNSEAGVFAKMIGSRKTSDVLDGLRLMVIRNGERLEQAIEAELPGEPTKEVTGLMNSVFNQAIQLAKLQDPSLRASPKIQIGISSGPNSQVTVEGSTSGQPGSNEIATALKELQEHGMNLKDITEDILVKYMSARETGDVRQIAAVVNQYTAIDAAPNSY